jgi:hypothetical protein
MKLALIIAAVVIGGGLMCNLLTKMAREECGRKCPTNTYALKERFTIGPFELFTCNCGEVQPDATGEGSNP